MATWIKANGATETVTPANGESFTLEELQRYVGGYVEVLELSDGTLMWLNEEGKLHELPYNAAADEIAHRLTGIAWSDGIVGDVLIATEAESDRGAEEDED